MTWGSVIPERPTLDNRILFGCVQYSKVHEAFTLREFYRVLVWSLNALAEGFHPYTDQWDVPFSREHYPDRFLKAGTPLTSDGWIGAFSEFRADWKYLAEVFQFHAMFSSLKVCHLCRAHAITKRLLWTQFRENDYLRRTRYTHDDWMLYVANQKYYHGAESVSPLWDIIGLDVWRVWMDALHVLDLGIYPWAIGSIVWELSATTDVWPGSNRKVRIFQAFRGYRGNPKHHLS